MSYVFTSPKYYVRQCPMDEDSLGSFDSPPPKNWGPGIEQWLNTPTTDSIGPDQPWSEKTAGKEIVPATKECYEGWQQKWNYIYGKPSYKSGRGGYVTKPTYTLRVRNYKFEDCFPTGRIDEADKPGGKRHEWWCCPPTPKMKPERAFTQSEEDLYGKDICQPFYHSGEVYLGEPRWLDDNFMIPTGWDHRETDIIDKGYRLFCYAEKPEGYWKNLLASTDFSTTQYVTQAIDEAQRFLEHEQRVAEEEAIVQAVESEFEYSFFERYGLYMAIGAGVIGLGLLAGLIKRSVS
jgi:hypothetical protein